MSLSAIALPAILVCRDGGGGQVRVKAPALQKMNLHRDAIDARATGFGQKKHLAAVILHPGGDPLGETCRSGRKALPGRDGNYKLGMVLGNFARIDCS